MPFLFGRRPPGSQLWHDLKRKYGKRATIQMHQLAPLVITLVTSKAFKELTTASACLLFEAFLVASGDNTVRKFVSDNPGWALDAIKLFCD